MSRTAKVCPVSGTGVKPSLIETCAASATNAVPPTTSSTSVSSACAGQDGEAESCGLSLHQVLRPSWSNLGCTLSQGYSRVVRDILPILERWAGLGIPTALGTVVERVGSAPRDPGASLACRGADELAGSVTGGCVDPAVIREAKEVLAGAPGRLRRFGLDGEETVGRRPSCGGTIAVAIYRLEPELVLALAEAVRADQPVARHHPARRGSLR